MPKMKIYLIHNTHTDVGFTGTQEEVEYLQYDYLRQVISILESGNERFMWQCENMWQIDNFYANADENEKNLLEKWIRKGNIGLSGNYLNMTEVADAETLDYWVKHAREYADRLSVPSESAMSCDVDGYGWGFAGALSRNGYRYFLGSIHTHHGMYPMGKCPSCFYWEEPGGGRVLTFISEHYNLGNELGLCPHSMLSYSLHDKYSRDLEFTMLRTDAGTTEREELETAVYRLRQYKEGLIKSGYPFDCVPVLISGAYADNAPPNAAITERVGKLNRLLDGEIEIEFSVLDTFFRAIEAQAGDIPCFRGDFPDWWASGTGTLPNSVSMYKEAQRFMRLGAKLDPQGKYTDAAMKEEALRNAILFAEHTWSYCATVYYPWSRQNKGVELKNAAYASAFHTLAIRNLLRIKKALGDRQSRVRDEFKWTVLNPHEIRGVFPAALPIEAWEYVDGIKFDPSRYGVWDDTAGKMLTSQVTATTRGPAYIVLAELDAHEKCELRLVKKDTADVPFNHNTSLSTDGVRDIAPTGNVYAPSLIESPFFRIVIEREKGITALYDKVNNVNLMPEGSDDFLSCVRDYTPVALDDGTARKLTRRSMGRSIVSMATRRSRSRLISSVITENGPLYATAELDYAVDGARKYTVKLKVYKTIPRMDAEVILCAEGSLNPESFYIALPLVSDGDTYIGKAGCVMRPGIDQLPGTCQAFYELQNGIIRQNGGSDLLVQVEDIPLILFGLPESAPVELCGGANTGLNGKPMYLWAVNNYWETNFPCNTAGDYRFGLTFTAVPHDGAREQMERIMASEEGAVVLRR